MLELSLDPIVFLNLRQHHPPVLCFEGTIALADKACESIAKNCACVPQAKTAIGKPSHLVDDHFTFAGNAETLLQHVGEANGLAKTGYRQLGDDVESVSPANDVRALG